MFQGNQRDTHLLTHVCLNIGEPLRVVFPSFSSTPKRVPSKRHPFVGPNPGVVQQIGEPYGFEPRCCHGTNVRVLCASLASGTCCHAESKSRAVPLVEAKHVKSELPQRQRAWLQAHRCPPPKKNNPAKLKRPQPKTKTEALAFSLT